MNAVLRRRVLLVSGALGFIVPTYYGWTLYENHSPQNVATWGMVFVLDMLGLILVLKDGNQKPFLQIGWALASICILSAVLLNGSPLGWGRTETISVIIASIAIAIWLTWSAEKALWAYMVAMYVSFYPLMADYWDTPQPDTLWLWLMTVVSCLLAILGAEKYNFANLFVPIAAIILNIIIAVLCLV